MLEDEKNKKKYPYKYVGITFITGFVLLIYLAYYLIVNWNGHIVVHGNRLVGFKYGLIDKNGGNEKLTIPEGITEIGDFALKDCVFIKEIELPESLEYIGKGAFYNCNTLSYINLPEKLKVIDDKAFCLCISLSNVNITKIFLLRLIKTLKNLS